MCVCVVKWRGASLRRRHIRISGGFQIQVVFNVAGRRFSQSAEDTGLLVVEGQSLPPRVPAQVGDWTDGTPAEKNTLKQIDGQIKC